MFTENKAQNTWITTTRPPFLGMALPGNGFSGKRSSHCHVFVFINCGKILTQYSKHPRIRTPGRGGGVLRGKKDRDDRRKSENTTLKNTKP